MGRRIVITKSSAAGEQLTLQLTQCNEITGEPELDTNQFMEEADNLIKLADSRTQDMNLRHLEAYQLDKYFEPHIWYRVRAILGAIGGQQTVQSLAQRWEAEVEETKALEQGRLEAQAKGNGQGVYEFKDEWYAVGGPRDAPLVIAENGDYRVSQVQQDCDISYKLCELCADPIPHIHPDAELSKVVKE